jgi:copper resistance protein B
MIRVLILAAASALTIAAPALAQPAGRAAPAASAAPAAPAADPACPPEHAAMGHCTPKSAAPVTAAPPAADPSCPPEHAAMGHCTPAGAAPLAAPTPPPAPATDPNCPPEHAAMGHCTPAPAVPGSAPAAAPPVAPPPPEALGGPENAADTVWDPKLMASKRATELIAMHGAFRGSMVLLDRFEYRAVDGRDGYAWDGEGWYGGDYDRLWVKTEGEGVFGEAVEAAEVQALYSRAIDPWFNLQAGIRYDIRPEPDRAHLVVGIQGLAPYWFEVDAAAFLSDEGDLTARLEAEYDQRLTNRLILQPRVELDLAAQDVPEIGIGAGLSSIEAGLRLRYQIEPEFAPYVGVQYERRLGDTADFARAAGEEAGGWALLVGLRSWF